MTLCVAAACKHNGRDAVILGSDFRVEGMSRADILDKLYWINNKEWPVLISGDDISEAIELKEVYRQTLEKRIDINLNQLLALMHEPLQTQKNRLADQYVSREIGKSYSYLLERGKEELPESIRSDLLTQIRRIKLQADLIIVVFVKVTTTKGNLRRYKRPLIFVVGEDGVEWCEQYACIGSGSFAAESVLAYREHDEEVHSDRAMYHVHEAMTLGAAVGPGVGEGALAIVYDDGDRIISEQPRGSYRAILRNVFKKHLGPRLVAKVPKLRQRDLTEF